MTERPILFLAPMVRAILDGRKTQTRRAIKPQPIRARQPDAEGYVLADFSNNADALYDHEHIRCPYGVPGDRLWVRETWGWDWYDDGQSRAWKRPVYRADPEARPSDNGTPTSWTPSIFMPRRASRITLEVVDVRVERLQDISEADSRVEGAPCVDGASEREVLFPDACNVGSWRLGYRSLWETINGAGSWDANPWVWVVEFRKVP